VNQETKAQSRVHDLLSASLGAFAAFCLITSPWNVDTEGPDPFYKGPLIFPIMVLSMMVLASLPACRRLFSPAAGSSWRLDGGGYPRKTLIVLGLLIAMLAGLNLIGLEVCALAFLSVSLYILGHRGPFKLIVLPLVMTGLIVLIFKYFLGVFFPTPLIAEWIWE
jgi:hypothetical protein